MPRVYCFTLCFCISLNLWNYRSKGLLLLGINTNFWILSHISELKPMCADIKRLCIFFSCNKIEVANTIFVGVISTSTPAKSSNNLSSCLKTCQMSRLSQTKIRKFRHEKFQALTWEMIDIIPSLYCLPFLYTALIIGQFEVQPFFINYKTHDKISGGSVQPLSLVSISKNFKRINLVHKLKE